MAYKKQDHRDGIMSIIAAILVLFAALIEPQVSATIAVILMLIFAAYKFMSR